MKIISKYRELRFPEKDDRREPSEVKTYRLSPEELEELNKKYPPKQRKMDLGEKSAFIVAEMNKNMQEKRELKREE